MMPFSLKRSLHIFALLSVAGGCARNPATGERQFNVLSRPREIELGAQAAPQFLASYGGELPAPEVINYVRNIGGALARDSERPNLPWEFHVVDSDVVNAFALPGGKVFVSRALLAKLDNEAELAGVLGHEIGHVTAQHIGQQMSRQLAIMVAATAVGVVAEHKDEDWLRALGVGAQLGGTVYLLHFGRDQELQADGLGIRYMSRAGYNPEGQVQVLSMLADLSRSGPRQPEILSTHPDPAHRVKAARALIGKHYESAARKNALEPTRYHEVVLAALSRLPAPKHRGETQQQRQQMQRIERVEPR